MRRAARPSRVADAAPAASGPRRDGQPKPREPDPEERAAPFVEERRGRLGAAVLDRLGHLRGRVARAGERRRELGVRSRRRRRAARAP